MLALLEEAREEPLEAFGSRFLYRPRRPPTRFDGELSDFERELVHLEGKSLRAATLVRGACSERRLARGARAVIRHFWESW